MKGARVGVSCAINTPCEKTHTPARLHACTRTHAPSLSLSLSLLCVCVSLSHSAFCFSRAEFPVSFSASDITHTTQQQQFLCTWDAWGTHAPHTTRTSTSAGAEPCATCGCTVVFELVQQSSQGTSDAETSVQGQVQDQVVEPPSTSAAAPVCFLRRI